MLSLILRIAHEAFPQLLGINVLTKLYPFVTVCNSHWIYTSMYFTNYHACRFIWTDHICAMQNELLNCCSSHPTCHMSLQRRACCKGWTPTSNIKTGVSSRSRRQNGRHIQPFLLSWELMANPVKMLAGSKVKLDCCRIIFAVCCLNIIKLTRRKEKQTFILVKIESVWQMIKFFL